MLLGITDDDLPFLRQVALVEAAFPPGTPRPPDPLGDDHILRYVDGWGRDGDAGLVAWEDGRPVGAAWTRLMPADRPGYGFVDTATPELTVAVAPRHRGRGLGRALVVGALDVAAVAGHVRISLSVADGTNPGAAHLYRSVGFAPVRRDEGGSLTMVIDTRPRPPADDTGPPVARPARGDDGPALLRLREQMMTDMGQGGLGAWPAAFLSAWGEGAAAGRLLATVVDGDDGRPIASAVAHIHDDPRLPGPVPDHGPDALVSSVATETTWRRRGAARACLVALQQQLVERGVGRAHLRASTDGLPLYRQLGFEVPDLPRLRWVADPG